MLNLLRYFAASLLRLLSDREYDISYSALSLRFKPNYIRSNQAKLHKNYLDMKVMLPQNDQRKTKKKKRCCKKNAISPEAQKSKVVQ
jgi:hypothetical protein